MQYNFNDSSINISFYRKLFTINVTNFVASNQFDTHVYGLIARHRWGIMLRITRNWIGYIWNLKWNVWIIFITHIIEPFLGTTTWGSPFAAHHIQRQFSSWRNYDLNKWNQQIRLKFLSARWRQCDFESIHYLRAWPESSIQEFLAYWNIDTRNNWT